MTHSPSLVYSAGSPAHISWLPWARQIFLFIGISRLRRTVCLLSSLAEKDAATEENQALLIAITCADYRTAGADGLHQTARVWHFYARRRPGRDAPGKASSAAVYRISLCGSRAADKNDYSMLQRFNGWQKNSVAARACLSVPPRSSRCAGAPNLV